MIFLRKIRLPVPAADAFLWHKQPGAFKRLLPPWEKIKLLSHSDAIHDGARAKLNCNIFGPFGFNWLLEHQDYIPDKQFTDVQLKGPFSSYRHLHLFKELGELSELTDQIEYKLPFSKISHLLAPLLIDKRLDRTFRYRHRITFQDLEFHQQYKDKPRLNFLISGSGGMIGQALCCFLTTAGHKVTRIVRSRPETVTQSDRVVFFDKGKIVLDRNSDFDCVVNLAGAGIADRRWSAQRKRELIESRVNFTSALIASLKDLNNPPRTIISASGVGYYGDVTNTDSDEKSPKGSGFLSDLSDSWEQAADSALKDYRVIKLRLATVLNPAGGALKKMLFPFSVGMGAKLGSGKQKFAWVALDDVLRAILFLSYNDQISGAVNLVAPQSLSNAEFTRELAVVLGRPALFRIPAPVLKIIFGEMADQTLLASSRAVPQKLLDHGFSFLFEDLAVALKASLGKPL